MPSFNDLRDKTPEGRARVAEYERTMRAVMRLAELRAERGVTQDELARGMDVSQAHVSQIERKDNLYLSTLHNYVEALGGQLRLCAVFPDQQEIDLDVRLLRRGTASSRRVARSLLGASMARSSVSRSTGMKTSLCQ